MMIHFDATKTIGAKKLYGIYLIAALAVTGGAIAFIGDRLGTKIGKKRLSIFGLRPRHTSNVITVITGILITGLTIGLLSLASKEVRTALFGLDELNANLESARRELNLTSDELASVRLEYDKANADLEKSREDVEQLQQEQLELREESTRLKEGNRTLELTNARLIEDNDQLLSDNDRLTADNDRLAGDNDRLASDNDRLTEDNDRLTTDNKTLEERTERLRNGLTAMREGDIVFRAGEILASAVLTGHRDADAIVDEIDELAQRATDNVSERSGQEESVWIYQPELRAAVDRISQSDGEVLLRIVAAGNLMRGEPIRTTLELYDNDTIFKQDEFITARAYEIAEQGLSEEIIRDFLRVVNQAAVEKGVLPDPIRGTVGVMEGTQFYQLVEALSELKGPIMLTAYAREETKTMGPLRLNVKLEHPKD